MNNGFESDREFREWQAAVAMQYGIQPGAVRPETTGAAEPKVSRAVKRSKLSAPKRRATDKKAKA